jgi:hypothetical protein
LCIMYCRASFFRVTAYQKLPVNNNKSLHRTLIIYLLLINQRVLK